MRILQILAGDCTTTCAAIVVLIHMAEVPEGHIVNQIALHAFGDRCPYVIEGHWQGAGGVTSSAAVNSLGSGVVPTRLLCPLCHL